MKSRIAATLAALTLALSGAGVVAAGSASASSKPCVLQYHVTGCKVRPGTFHVNGNWGSLNNVHWSGSPAHWNYRRFWGSNTAHGTGHIPHSGDDAELKLSGVTHHHFTRLTIVTQGEWDHFRWSNGRWTR